MDGVGRSRRPAGRDRPGLILEPRRYRVARAPGNCEERIGLQLLQGQRRLTRQTRAPSRGNPPPFPGPLCGPLFDGAAVRLRFRRLGFRLGRRLFIDDDGGTAERRDPGRGGVAFE